MTKLNEIRGKLKENANSLYMGQVPPKIKQWFIDLAENDFNGNYGMLMLNLHNMYMTNQLINSQINSLWAELEGMKQRVFELENEPEKPERRSLEPKRIKEGKE